MPTMYLQVSTADSSKVAYPAGLGGLGDLVQQRQQQRRQQQYNSTILVVKPMLADLLQLY